MESNYPRDNMGGQPTEAELKQFNWGALLLNWIWGLNHKHYMALLCFIPCVGLIYAIYLGFKGNEIAWQSGRFSSADEMHKCQVIWAKWGVGVLVAAVVLNILQVMVLGAAVASGAAR